MSAQFFMLVNKGMVQRYIGTDTEGRPAKVWPIAETHADATRLAKWLKAPHVRPALIGSVKGETLEGHIALALNEECVAVYCVAGWNEDGSPKWKWLPMPSE